TKLPLVHAELRAKRVASTRDLKGAPSAKTASVRTARMRLAVDPTALHGPRSTHKLVCKLRNESPGVLSANQYKVRHLRGIRSQWQRGRVSAHQNCSWAPRSQWLRQRAC